MIVIQRRFDDIIGKMFRAGVAIAALFGIATAQTTTLQAESATLSGVTVATSVAGFTGTIILMTLDFIDT